MLVSEANMKKPVGPIACSILYVGIGAQVGDAVRSFDVPRNLCERQATPLLSRSDPIATVAIRRCD